MSNFTPSSRQERFALAFALCLGVLPIVTVAAGLGIL